MVERIIPSHLDGEDLYRRNGEYVPAVDYDAAQRRIADLEDALRSIERLPHSPITDMADSCEQQLADVQNALNVAATIARQALTSA